MTTSVCNRYRQIIARQQSVIGLSAKLHIGASLVVILVIYTFDMHIYTTHHLKWK